MLILPESVSKVEEKAAICLEAAFHRSSVHLAKIWIDRCKMDLAQLWEWADFWAVTEVQSAKQGLVLHIVAAAGKFDPKHLQEMEAWGESVGCVDVFFSGRRGWSRKLPDFKIETVTLRKRLKNG